MMEIIGKKKTSMFKQLQLYTNTFLQTFMHNKNEFTEALIIVKESSSVS